MVCRVLQHVPTSAIRTMFERNFSLQSLLRPELVSVAAHWGLSH